MFYFFNETLNSHNLETASHTAHIIFFLHSTIKTHLLTKQIAYYPNYFNYEKNYNYSEY